jgi:hypothetical protein
MSSKKTRGSGPLSNTLRDLNVHYFNVHGLQNKKLEKIEKWIKNKEVDLMMISETWFIQKELKKGFFTIAESKKPAIAKEQGHELGGIAILGNAEMKMKIGRIITEEHWIALWLGENVITCVYLPPSLSLREISDILENIPEQTTMLVGDINVRFGDNGDKIKRDLQRGQLISEWCIKRNLYRRLSTNRSSDCDHLFSKFDLQWEYERLEKKFFESDHGRMMWKLPWINEVLDHSNCERKYAFSLLSNKMIRASFKGLWNNYTKEKISSYINEGYRCLTVKIKQKDREHLVEEVYDNFTEALYELCDKILPQYTETMVRTQIDPTLVLEEECPTVTASIRAFKRSKRGTQTRIIGTMDGVSPIAEAETRFKKIFKGGGESAVGCIGMKLNNEEIPVVFTTNDITKTIQTYPTHKSGGMDGLHTALFKHLIHLPMFPSLLADLYQLFYITGCTPSKWNLSKLHLIPKDKGHPTIDKCRPISLTQCLRRFFEKILLRQFQSEKNWTQIDKHQAGFRSGFSTMSQIMTVDEWTRRGKQLSLFLDLKSAYDLCSHRKLLRILRKRGCTNRNINLIHSLMMKNCLSYITVNQVAGSNPVHREKGLFQGSLLSPFLFNIFIDSLALTLNSEKENSAWLFADDVCVKATTETELIQLISECEKWARLNGMIWNLSKCGIMGNVNPHYLEGELIPNVKEYKYLGVQFEKNGVNWTNHDKLLCEKQKRILQAVSQFKLVWSIKTKLTIYKSFIRSSGEYCLPLLSTWLSKQSNDTKTASMNRRKEVHDKACEWILNTRANRKINDSLLGIGDPAFRSNTLQASFCGHMEKLNPTNPVLELIRASNVTSALKKDSFIHLVSKHPWWREFKVLRQTKEDATFKTFIRNKWLEENAKETGVLLCYIDYKVRMLNLADPCLFQPSKQISQTFANWRLNTLCFNKGRCPCCKERIKRTCFERCPTLTDNQELLEIRDSPEFHKQVAIVRKTIEDNGRKSNFGVIDFCLNKGLYDLAARGLISGLSRLEPI